MAAKILRRPRALKDAEEIADTIALDSRAAAVRFLENTEATLQTLAAFPAAGGPFVSARTDLANLRFRRVRGFPNHVIFYIDHTDSIEVVRILHGARDIEAELGRT